MSIGNLNNSWCGVMFTVGTDGENWDLEISLEYYDLAQSLGTRGSGRTDMLYLSLSMRLSSDAINQSQKLIFCSGWPKHHTHSSWFLNWASNSNPCYSLVGVPTPENLTLWWEPKRNTLYLEDKTQDAYNILEFLPKCPHSCWFCSKWSDGLLPATKGLPLFHYAMPQL